MSFFDTRPRLQDRDFRQLSGDTITLSGGTYIHGDFRVIPGATNGYVLTSDSNGFVSWQPPSGGSGGTCSCYGFLPLSGGSMSATTKITNSINTKGITFGLTGLTEDIVLFGDFNHPLSPPTGGTFGNFGVYNIPDNVVGMTQIDYTNDLHAGVSLDLNDSGQYDMLELFIKPQSSSTRLTRVFLNETKIDVKGAFVSETSSASTNSFSWGNNNSSNGSNTFIGGGYLNKVNGDNASIIGGGRGKVYSIYSSIVGGWKNYIYSNSNYSTIVNGYNNTISASSKSTIIGGTLNSMVNTTYSTIGGGAGNYTKNAVYSTIGGGAAHVIDGSIGDAIYNVIGGGKNNQIVGSSYSSVIGGYNNVIGHDNSHIIGSNLNSFRDDTTHVENLYLNNKLTCNVVNVVFSGITTGYTISDKSMVLIDNTISGGTVYLPPASASTGDMIWTITKGNTSSPKDVDITTVDGTDILWYDGTYNGTSINFSVDTTRVSGALWVSDGIGWFTVTVNKVE